MKSFMAKKEEVQAKWWLADADGKVLGRMAAEIAPILMGKTKPTYTPHVDLGDYVIVVNAEKIKVTGKKAQTKEYDYYTGYPGGHKYVSFEDMMAKKTREGCPTCSEANAPKKQTRQKNAEKTQNISRPGTQSHCTAAGKT